MPLLRNTKPSSKTSAELLAALNVQLEQAQATTLNIQATANDEIAQREREIATYRSFIAAASDEIAERAGHVRESERIASIIASISATATSAPVDTSLTNTPIILTDEDAQEGQS
jgi:hypothetical protein